MQSISIEKDRYSFEPEIPAEIAELGSRMYRARISCYGKPYTEGKKIGWKTCSGLFTAL